jgi:hypothetical protein
MPEPELVGAVATPRAGTAASPDTTVSGEAGAGDRAWVEPLDDGSCPATHPIKANDPSHIFHVPGGRFYERTDAVRCYSSPEAATSDGYRPAKA